MRFIFHQSFKKYKDIEAEAVKQFVATLSEFEVEYAFVHVSTSHGWKLFDPESKGASYRRAGLKARRAAPRYLCAARSTRCIGDAHRPDSAQNRTAGLPPAHAGQHSSGFHLSESRLHCTAGFPSHLHVVAEFHARDHAGLDRVFQPHRRFTGTSAADQELEPGDAFDQAAGAAMVSVKPGGALQEPLERLRRAVVEQNWPGSLEGLLARHILGLNPHFTLDWRVECDRAWMDHYNPASLPMVASLGYSMAHDFHAEHLPALREGIQRAMGRDPLGGGHLNLNRHSATLLGLVLGVAALGLSNEEEMAWSHRLAAALPAEPDGAEAEVLYPYIRWTVLGEKAQIPMLKGLSLYQLSFYDWMIRRSLNRNAIAPEELRQTRLRVLELAATDLAFETAYQAAIRSGRQSKRLCFMHSIRGCRSPAYSGRAAELRSSDASLAVGLRRPFSACTLDDPAGARGSGYSLARPPVVLR